MLRGMLSEKCNNTHLTNYSAKIIIDRQLFSLYITVSVAEDTKMSFSQIQEKD